MTLRKGQKIINYFKFVKGISNENIHCPIFHMDDELFDKILADDEELTTTKVSKYRCKNCGYFESEDFDICPYCRWSHKLQKIVDEPIWLDKEEEQK